MTNALLAEFPPTGEAGKPVPVTFQVTGPVSAPKVLVKITGPDGAEKKKEVTCLLTAGGLWKGETDFLPYAAGQYAIEIEVVRDNLRQEATIEVVPAAEQSPQGDPSAAKLDEGAAEVPDEGSHDPLSVDVSDETPDPPPSDKADKDFFSKYPDQGAGEDGRDARWGKAFIGFFAVCFAYFVAVGIWGKDTSPVVQNTMPTANTSAPNSAAPVVATHGIPASATTQSAVQALVSPTWQSVKAMETMGSGNAPKVVSDGKGGFHQVLGAVECDANGKCTQTFVDIIANYNELVGKVAELGDRLDALVSKPAQVEAKTLAPKKAATSPKVVASAAPASSAFKPEQYGQYVAKVSGGVETLSLAKTPLFQGVFERRTAPDGTEYFVQRSDITITPISTFGK
ncbi:MAG: hypothetical protein AAB444_02775 [Patescibacteria group bacterium]